MHNLRSCKAFSLVELSISITIIALLAAAIIAGQSIKQRLQLNQIVEQVGSINNAVNNFKTSYGGIPGDLYNASTIFGETKIGNKIADGLGSGNGNGNGIIESNLTSPPRNEQLLFWQHLAAATLIEGSYDGKTTGKDGLYKTSFKNVYFEASSNISENNKLYLIISKIIDNQSNYGAFTTKQAYEIDSKYDDGNPLTGTIRAIDGKEQAKASCIIEGNYNLSNHNDDTCILHFYLQ